MSETHKSFTPEQRIAFEEKYNLGVYNHEAMIELLMQQNEHNKQQDELLSHYINRVIQLEERLDERRDAIQEANESPFRD